MKGVEEGKCYSFKLTDDQIQFLNNYQGKSHQLRPLLSASTSLPMCSPNLGEMRTRKSFNESCNPPSWIQRACPHFLQHTLDIHASVILISLLVKSDKQTFLKIRVSKLPSLQSKNRYGETTSLHVKYNQCFKGFPI